MKRPSERAAMRELVIRVGAIRCACGWYKVPGYKCPTEGCKAGE